MCRYMLLQIQKLCVYLFPFVTGFLQRSFYRFRSLFDVFWQVLDLRVFPLQFEFCFQFEEVTLGFAQGIY